MKNTLVVAAILLSGISSSAQAQDKVIVIPMGGEKTEGNAVAEDVLEGKTFSNSEDVGINGVMVNNGAVTLTPGATSQNIPLGYHNGSGTVAGDVNLTPGNIKSGVTIFGIGGTVIGASGTATSEHVLSGQSFSNASGSFFGTMTNVGAQNVTPGTSVQAIAQGYHNGSGIVAGDSDLSPENIKSGVTIFGVSGDVNVVNTSTGDATAGEMLDGKKAWVDGSEVTGTLPTQVLSNTSTAVSAGYYTATNLATVDTDLIAQNIACGKTIFGVTGTYTGMPNTVCSAGQVWMDRNLGASQVATSSTDSLAYGDLYQWGRLADGHEKRDSPTTTTLSASDVPGNSSFILAPSSPYDWRTPQKIDLWQGVTGINNPCPVGLRLPTTAEWEIERASWSSNDAVGAFASPLKLVLAGSRYNNVGTIGFTESGGYYWSSDVFANLSRNLLFSSGSASMDGDFRATGYSVRCIRD